MSDTAITFISYIDTMQEKIKSIYIEINKSSTSSEVVDYLDEIKHIVKLVDKYTMLTIDTASQLLHEYRAKINILHSSRNKLLDIISKNKSSCIQTNISSSFYNENDLISNIYISNVETGGTIRLRNIKIEPLTDPKDYSYIALTKRFESEGLLLEEINRGLSIEFERILKMLNDIQNNNLAMKTRFADIQLIEELCNNSESGKEFIQQIGSSLIIDIGNLDCIKSMINKMHQTCIALTENYSLYSKVIDNYSLLTIEAFFDKNAPYEIC